MSSQSSHHPQEVLLAQFSLCVHKGGLKPDSFHFELGDHTTQLNTGHANKHYPNKYTNSYNKLTPCCYNKHYSNNYNKLTQCGYNVVPPLYYSTSGNDNVWCLLSFVWTSKQGIITVSCENCFTPLSTQSWQYRDRRKHEAATMPYHYHRQHCTLHAFEEFGAL